MIAPTSQVELIRNVDITKQYRNTFSFADLSAQSTFFLTKPRRLFSEFQYVRKEKVLRVRGKYDELLVYNYLRFKNSDFGDKWFYAFVNDMKYLSDEVTEITFEIDVIQTWLFDMDIKTSFIEREHVDDDTFGKHLVLENLDVGEYVTKAVDAIPALFPQAVIIATTYLPDDYAGGARARS